MRKSWSPWAVILLLACRPPPAPTAAAPQADPLPTKPPSLCTAARDRSRPHRELLRRVDTERAQRSGSTPESEPLLQALDFCIETPRGAWALSLDRLERTGELGVTGRWVIAHLSPDGSRETVAPALPDGHSCDLTAVADNFVDVTADAHLTIRPPIAYDYDHDGEPELVVVLEGHIHEGGDWRRGRVWTYRQGVVALYPPAADIVVRDTQDIDHDGKPDLLTVGPFAEITEWPGGPGELIGPQLVAHALPDGRFSLDDQVARTSALRVCPDRPKALVAWERAGGSAPRLDRAATAVHIACARLWGADPPELETRITRECPKGKDPNQDCDVDALRKLAKVAVVPIKLQESPPSRPQ